MAEQSSKPPTDRPELVLEINDGPIEADERWLTPFLGGVALTEERLADLNMCKLEGSPMQPNQYRSKSMDLQRRSFYNHPVFGWTQEGHELYDMHKAIMAVIRGTTRPHLRLPPIPNRFVAVCRMIDCVTPETDDLVPLFQKLWRASYSTAELVQGRIIEASEAGYDMPQGLKSLSTRTFMSPQGHVPPPKNTSPNAVLLVKPKADHSSLLHLNNLHGEHKPSDELHQLITASWPELEPADVFDHLPQDEQDAALWDRLTNIAQQLAKQRFEVQTPRQLARELLKYNRLPE